MFLHPTTLALSEIPHLSFSTDFWGKRIFACSSLIEKPEWAVGKFIFGKRLSWKGLKFPYLSSQIQLDNMVYQTLVTGLGVG